MSLTVRFLLGFAVAAALGLYLFISGAIQRVERQYMEAVEEPMVDVANIVAEWAAVEFRRAGSLQSEALAQAWQAAQSRDLNARIYNLRKKKVDMQVYVADAEGRILFDSAGRVEPGSVVRYRDVMLTLNGAYGARATYADPRDPQSLVLFVGAPIIVDGKTVGMASIAKPLGSVVLFIRETESWLKAFGITVIIAMLIAVYLASRWATKPLDQLTQHALAVSRGERPAPLRMPGHHLKTLSRAFEGMRDALEGREYVESYVQSLTHELKSPVAAITGAAEILQGDVPEPKRSRFLQNIRSEADRLQDLLERLLHLAALEKQKRLSAHEPVEIRDLLNRVWDHLALIATARQVEWENRAPVGLKVAGDPWLIELAISNLLQNALDFSPPGTRIQASAEHRGGRVIIQIDDQGPGIPDYARERVFERFYSLPRPDTGKKSSGLGLCFVKEIASLHGGQVELTNLAVAKGARAILWLPSRA